MISAFSLGLMRVLKLRNINNMVSLSAISRREFFMQGEHGKGIKIRRRESTPTKTRLQFLFQDVALRTLGERI
jgi:hypothetical protein